MLLFFVINFGRFLSFVAHVQVLIADNFGIFTLFQALIEDNFVIFNPLRKNKHHPGLEPVWRIQNVLMRIRIHSTFFSKREKTFFLPNLHCFLLHKLTQLVMCNFLSSNAGGGAGGEG